MSRPPPLPPPLPLQPVDHPGPGLALLHPGPGLSAPSAALRRVEGGLLDLGTTPALLVRPGLRAVRAVPGGALLVTRSAPGSLLVERLGDGAAAPLLALRASGVRLGDEALAWWRGGDGGVRTLDDRPLGVPLAARGAAAVPFPGGVAWTAGRTLLRWTPDGGPRVTASLPAACRQLWAGPGGTCLAATAAGAVLVVPGREPVAVEEVEGAVLDVVFGSEQGARLCLEDEAGVLHRDTAGEVTRVEGARLAGPDHWLDPCGDLHPWSGTPGDAALPERLPGPALRLGDVLHGPAGRAWDLTTGRPVGPALTAGAELAATARELGAAALLADGAEILVRTADGEELVLGTLPEDALVLALQCRRGVVRAWDDQGRCWTGALDGADLAPASSSPPLPRPAPLPAAAAALGLPLDGGLVAPDGSTWAWQDDGPLFRLRGSSPQR